MLKKKCYPIVLLNLFFFMNIYKQLEAKQKNCIYKSPQGILVYQRHRYRWVLFNDLYIQTMIDTKKLERPLLPYLNPMLKLLSITPGQLCLLGLGGGGAIHALNPFLHQITVVEKYQEMIDIAKNFFFVKETPNLSIVCDCAANFLKQNQAQFQHIIVDLGDKYGFPGVCQNLEFFSNAYKCLTDNGLLILNLTHHSQIKDFFHLLQTVFNQRPFAISAQGNWLLVVVKGALARERLIEQLNKAQLIKSFSWDVEFGEQMYLRSSISISLHQLKAKVLNILKKAI